VQKGPSPGVQNDERVRAFHTRAGQSHAEARRLLTTIAVGSLGVLYATLIGKDAPELGTLSKLLALGIAVSMALAAGFGLAAWRADAAWAYDTAKHFKDPMKTEPPDTIWHEIKNWGDRFQVALFSVGVFLAALLTVKLILYGESPAGLGILVSVDWSTVWLAAQALGGLGIFGALATLVYGVWRERTQRKRAAEEERERRKTEMQGLLRMLLVEIEENERQFRGFREREARITNAPPGYLRWGVWEDARVRLAQLLEEEDALSDLARCYDMIQQIEAFRHIDRDRLEEQEVIKEINEKLPSAIERCQTAAKYIREQVPDATGASLPPSDK